MLLKELHSLIQYLAQHSYLISVSHRSSMLRPDEGREGKASLYQSAVKKIRKEKKKRTRLPSLLSKNMTLIPSQILTLFHSQRGVAAARGAFQANICPKKMKKSTKH